MPRVVNCCPRSQTEQMSTWRRHRAHRNNRASSMAPLGEEGWTIRHDRAILHSEPYASADLGAASDVDGQVLTVRGCVGLFAEPDLTPTSGWRHLIDAGAKRPWPTPSPQTPDKAGHKARAPGRFSRFSAGSVALRRSRQDQCAPFMRTFSQPPTHDSRLAHSSTAAQAALSACEATSTTTPLDTCTRTICRSSTPFSPHAVSERDYMLIPLDQ